MTVFPGPATALALLVGLGLVFFLYVMSHGALRIASLAKRFISAAAASLVFWISGVVLMYALGAAVVWNDLVAGGLIMFAAILSWFTLWTLVAWGFSLSLLMALTRAAEPMTEKSWFDSYAGIGGVERFGTDRLGILLKFNLASFRAGKISVTLFPGRPVAAIALVLSRLFGLSV
jgi:hypothetical protein